jgi:hypothetical protein
VLSHPLLVEAIQGGFVPVAIHNNAKGRDAEILRRYAEPAWNNPVVRLVGADGKDLVARRDGVYTVAGIAARMVTALQTAQRPVPGYLRLLALGGRPKFLTKASFAMH